jgi:ATP-dependent helicase/nuclease subunit B
MIDLDSMLSDVAGGRGRDPLAPVTVVVPSHIAGLQLRRRLAERGAYAAVRFETLARIAELLAAGDLAAAGRAPLARPIGDYACDVVAAESRGTLERVRTLAGYARVLRQIFGRLRQAGITNPDDAEAPPEAGHLPEILRLYGRFREETSAFYDPDDLLDAAANALRSRRAGAAGDLGAIYVVPPPPRSASGAELLAALRQVSPSYVEVGDRATVAEERFVLAPDPASEAREVVREVLRALEEGCGAHEVAVFHGSGSGYAKLLREAFAAADVPCVPAPGVPLAETPAGRGVLALVSLPDEDFARTAVMDFLAIAPLRRFLPAAEGESVLHMASAWDRLSRDAGITRGTERWRVGLRAYAEGRRAAAEDIEREARARAATFEMEQARNMERVVSQLASRLAPLARPEPATEFIAAFKSVVRDYFDAAAPGVAEVVEEIEQLGSVGAIGGAFDLPRFARMLRANLEAATVRERSFGDGVLVAHYRAAAGLRFERVVLCGAFEGAFPAGPGVDALVDDGAWSRLRQAYPHVEDAAARIERERAAAARAASAAQRAVTWSAPQYEAGGTREYYPGPPMVAAATKRDPLVTTATELKRRGADAWLRRPASPLASALAGPPLDRAEVELRRSVALRQSGRAAGAGHGHARPLTLLRSRRSGSFTEWDGNVAGAGAALGPGGPMSPTRLEHYATCGYRYFCGSVLRLNVVEEPDERETMDAAERGSLVHRVLEQFFRERQREGRPRPGEEWTDGDLDDLLAIAEREMEEAKRRGRTGLDVFASHEARTLRADLRLFLEEDTRFRRETGAVPSDFEVPLPDVTVAGVRLRGYVDRIDRTPDGKRAWVIDYKTGSSWGFDKITKDDDPLVGGTKLQLPVYLHAAADADTVRAAYWFISRKGEFERIEYPATDERRAVFERTLATIAAGIEGGVFPAVPGDEDERDGGFDHCKFCDYDRICSRRRDYELAAKQADAALDGWLAVERAAQGVDA